jgi:putative glutamine amidotransferase
MAIFKKKSKIKVGVTGNSRHFSPSWWCIKLSLFLVGARAIRISARHHIDTKEIDTLIISGGDDINPSLYQGDINPGIKIDDVRDKLEIKWIKWAIERNIPLLGICRGAQLINVVAGGSLHQNLKNIRVKTRNRSSIIASKLVRFTNDSKLSKLLNKNKLNVNSLHNQAINRLGNGLNAVAHDRDNIIQAIESNNNLKIFGVQWHPEYLFYLSKHRQIFKCILNTKKQ